MKNHFLRKPKFQRDGKSLAGGLSWDFCQVVVPQNKIKLKKILMATIHLRKTEIFLSRKRIPGVVGVYGWSKIVLIG